MLRTLIASLPHVGSVANRLETDLVNRTIAEIIALVTSRERRFAEHSDRDRQAAEHT